MKADSPDPIFSNLLRKYALALAGWSVLVAGSLAWNTYQEGKETLNTATATARASINKDIIFRKWVSTHGGVYVPPSERSPPNPYLNLPDRDVVTTTGKALTLMNPAYVLREMQNSFSDEISTRSHISSLKPLNPQNTADAWETGALKRFEQGSKEVIEVQQIDGQPYLRLMRPFVVESDCLKCHAQQGYKLGDIRGGIGTEVPLTTYLASERERGIDLALSHGLIWLIGLLGLGFSYRRERYLDNERNQAEIDLRESEARLRATIETAMDAVVKMNSEGVITGWNNQAERIFGWSHDEAIGRMMHETVIPFQYREAHVNGLKRFLLSGESAILNSRIEITGLHRDGHEFPLELSITSFTMAGKHEFSAFIRDITSKKESDELIWKQANFDMLTGLPNRRMFHDRLAQEIKKAYREDLKMVLLSIDLDKFKEVNDTLGHSLGDIALMEAARRISICVRGIDTVARLGGDEFAVILSGLDDISSIERVAGNILQQLAEPFQLGNEVAYISASIGITLYPDDATGMEGLLKNADQAMHTAKDKGRNRFSYFTQAMQDAAQTRLRLVNDLRGALAGNQFMVYFQPIVELATGRINKAEALIRWQHPERGMVGPAEFIPLAEETGLIFEIGDWVFHESMRWAKRWRALHNPLLQISVNKSPLQFYKDGDNHTAWLSHLRELDLPGQGIAIEITEGLLLDSNASIAGALLTLRNSDIQVSIDDFGTGYSSLSYLKKFDIDYLKIDQSFVRDLATDPNDLALSEAIIVMAHKLGIKVVAEGVETEQQRDLLVAAGCDYAQGYWYSRPVPPEEFEKLLREGLSVQHIS